MRNFSNSEGRDKLVMVVVVGGMAKEDYKKKTQIIITWFEYIQS